MMEYTLQVIGRGASRTVYQDKRYPHQVIKVDRRNGQRNRREWFVWKTANPTERLWLAPCIEISADGLYLTMLKGDPVSRNEVPDKAQVPERLHKADVWPRQTNGHHTVQENWVRMKDGRIVICDYEYAYNAYKETIMTNDEYIKRLTDHPADQAIIRYFRRFKPSHWKLLRTLSGAERKLLWSVLKDRAKRAGPIKRYCEIGVNCGASLWQVHPFMDSSGFMIGVDKNDNPEDERVTLRQSVVRHLMTLGVEVLCIEKDSVKAVTSVLPCAPFDVLFIDGDHSYEGVKHDWENYAPMLGKGGLLVMHDVNNQSFGVGKLWCERRDELKWSLEVGNLAFGETK